MTLNDDYINMNQMIAERQVVLGGNRLANMLKTLNLEQWKPEIEAQKAQQETYWSVATNYLISAFRI